MTLTRRGFISAGAALTLSACGEKPPDARPRWPDLSVRDLSGQATRIASTSRAPRVINFWALWCPPCRQELPSLERLARDFTRLGVEVSTIALADDEFPVREYLLQHARSLPSALLGPRTPDAQRLGLTTLPQTFAIAPDGTVLTGWIGAREWDAPEVRQDMARLLVAG